MNNKLDEQALEFFFSDNNYNIVYDIVNKNLKNKLKSNFFFKFI